MSDDGLGWTPEALEQRKQIFALMPTDLKSPAAYHYTQNLMDAIITSLAGLTDCDQNSMKKGLEALFNDGKLKIEQSARMMERVRRGTSTVNRWD